MIFNDFQSFVIKKYCDEIMLKNNVSDSFIGYGIFAFLFRC